MSEIRDAVCFGLLWMAGLGMLLVGIVAIAIGTN
jgi:hypothetical protein